MGFDNYVGVVPIFDPFILWKGVSSGSCQREGRADASDVGELGWTTAAALVDGGHSDYAAVMAVGLMAP